MPNTVTKQRQYHMQKGESVPDTVRMSGRFTTNGAATPTAFSTGPFNITRTAVGQIRVDINEPVVEILSVQVTLAGATASAQRAIPRSDLFVTGVVGTLTPASVGIETQSVAGTAADLTGPIVSFDIAYRKGSSRR